jgi:membrane-associated protein
MNGLWDAVLWLISLVMNIDEHLNAWAAQWGAWTYAVLFAIVFCETGLVVTPFLPGDSLLFAIGALCAMDGAVLEYWKVTWLLFVAAVLGDAVNYHVGKFIGPKVFTRDDSRFLKKEYLLRAQAFYEKYGAKAIVLARFVPIVRTFAPFVAGVGKMEYRKFLIYNVVGAAVWIWSLTTAGYYFGGLEFVKKHFELVVFAIIGLSILPIFIEHWKMKRDALASSRQV